MYRDLLTCLRERIPTRMQGNSPAPKQRGKPGRTLSNLRIPLLSAIGRMLLNSWLGLATQLDPVELDEYVVAPNLLHDVFIAGRRRAGSRTASTGTVRKPVGKASREFPCGDAGPPNGSSCDCPKPEQGLPTMPGFGKCVEALVFLGDTNYPSALGRRH